MLKHCAVLLPVLFLAPALHAAEDPQSVDGGFYLPDGDVQDGRKAFRELSCVWCHRVSRDTDLPAPTAAVKGPVLGFAKDTPNRVIAQSIIAPSHTIAYGYGQGDPEDAQESPMLDLTGQMTVQQMIDIVAYLKSMPPARDSVSQEP